MNRTVIWLKLLFFNFCVVFTWFLLGYGFDESKLEETTYNFNFNKITNLDLSAGYLESDTLVITSKKHDYFDLWDLFVVNVDRSVEKKVIDFSKLLSVRVKQEPSKEEELPKSEKFLTRETKSLTVYFKLNDSSLTKDQKEKIVNFIEDVISKTKPGESRYLVSVDGYACPIGGHDYNLKLSNRRAKAVVDFITSYLTNKKGFSKDQFVINEVKGHGKKKESEILCLNRKAVLKISFERVLVKKEEETTR